MSWNSADNCGWIAAGLLGIAAVGATVWALSETDEREQRRFHAEVDARSAQIAALEAKRRRLRKRLGRQHRRVRKLSAEIHRLRRLNRPR